MWISKKCSLYIKIQLKAHSLPFILHYQIAIILLDFFPYDFLKSAFLRHDSFTHVKDGVFVNLCAPLVIKIMLVCTFILRLTFSHSQAHFFISCTRLNRFCYWLILKLSSFGLEIDPEH